MVAPPRKLGRSRKHLNPLWISTTKPDKKKERHERIKFRIEIALGLGVALNILLTGGLLIAAIYQARYSGDQVAASQGQLKVMGEQERLQLRAYVGITQHGIENFAEQNQVLRATIKNYGYTPATDVFVAQPRVDVVPIITNFGPTVCIPAPQVQHTFWLYPTQEWPFEFRGPNLSPSGQPITKQQADLVRNGSQYRVMYWGVVFYKDVFGAQRCARYCWSFGGTDMGEKRTEVCLQHNDGL